MMDPSIFELIASRSKKKATSPIAKKLSWIPHFVRRDKRPGDTDDKGHIEDLAVAIENLVLAPTITNEPGPGKRKESIEYQSKGPTQGGTSSACFSGSPLTELSECSGSR